MTDWILYFFEKVALVVCTGLFTSTLFLIILSRFRPKICISPVIAKSLHADGTMSYRIKVINGTSAPITDITAHLHVFRNHQTATGEIWRTKPIELKRCNPLMIDKFDPNDKDCNYAYRFRTSENLEEIWDDDNTQFLRFRIFARHSISGFGKLAFTDYRLKRASIVDGEFSKGNTFEIV